MDRRVALALLCAMAGCRPAAPPRPPDAATLCIPADTVALAGLDLDRLRASPLYSKLPVAALGAYSSASSALVAYNGKDVLVIARGKFAQVPAGATMAAANVALFGSAQLVSAALAQMKSGATGAPALVALGGGAPLWIVTQGGAPLPLTGNAANYNRLIRKSESVAITANFDSGFALAITAIGQTDDAARDIEETLRADLTLGAAGLARQPDIAKVLQAARVERDGRTVRITLTADANAAAKLLSAFGL